MAKQCIAARQPRRTILVAERCTAGRVCVERSWLFVRLVEEAISAEGMTGMNNNPDCPATTWAVSGEANGIDKDGTTRRRGRALCVA